MFYKEIICQQILIIKHKFFERRKEMRTTKQAIPRETQDIRKRAYRDYSMGKITKKQLNKILDCVKALQEVAIEINEKQNIS